MDNEPARLEAADRAEFEHALREALTAPDIRQALAQPSTPVTADHLCARALAAADTIAAEAAAEYTTLCQLRVVGAQASRAMPRRARPTTVRHGLLTALAVLTPVLSAAAAVIFLLIGYVLHLTDTQQSPADSLIETGWAALAVAVIAGVAAVAGLFITASRHRTTSSGPDSITLTQAHTAWRKALLEQGLLPFLRRQLKLSPPPTHTPLRTPPPAQRRPRLGYSSPDFTGPTSPSQN